MTDETALSSPLAGADDFDDLYERCFTCVVAALCLLGDDPLDAEDRAEEAFARVALRWGTIGDAPAYVFRTALRSNARAQRWRRIQQGRRSQPAEADEGLVVRTTVEVALARLDRRPREVAVLAWYVGCSPEEIAKVLRIRPAAVAAHLDAAGRALRDGRRSASRPSGA